MKLNMIGTVFSNHIAFETAATTRLFTNTSHNVRSKLQITRTNWSIMKHTNDKNILNTTAQYFVLGKGFI